MRAAVNAAVALLATTVPSETRLISHENSEGYVSVKTSMVVPEEGGREGDGREGDGGTGDGEEGDGREGDGGAGDGEEGDGGAGDGGAGDGEDNVKVWVLTAPKDVASCIVTSPTESVTLPDP